MKKTLCILTAIVVCMVIAVTTVAASVFVPSVTAKSAPEFVLGSDGSVGFEIVDETDKNVATFDAGHVVITAVANRNEASTVDREALNTAYETLSTPNVKLDQVMPSLSEITVQEKVNVADVVVKDLFNVSTSEDVQKVLTTNGNGLKLTIDAKVSRNQVVAVMVCANGKWTPVPFVVNTDGTITCTMTVVGVVAILVKP